MKWDLFFATFISIFVAELGDKTQLASFSMAAGSPSKFTVFAGAALALVVSSAIAVVAGDVIARFISPEWLRRAAGVIFIVLGVLYIKG